LHHDFSFGIQAGISIRSSLDAICDSQTYSQCSFHSAGITSIESG